LRLIAGGAVPAERLVTHRFPLERTEEALAAARSREGVKVIVTSSA
jgi:L-iditol 2-dehydrogenase